MGLPCKVPPLMCSGKHPLDSDTYYALGRELREPGDEAPINSDLRSWRKLEGNEIFKLKKLKRESDSGSQLRAEKGRKDHSSLRCGLGASEEL